MDDVRESMTGTPSPTSGSRFLIVTVGGRYLALNAESICGLLTLEETGQVENPTVHGMAYGAIKLADRLSLPNDQGETDTRVVLLSEREARGSIRVTTVQGLFLNSNRLKSCRFPCISAGRNSTGTEA